ncbi:MAG: hypothetical protein NT121_16700 [Chloroflexi bacterium]|nr:hypothetical protein [Chloroflexota bacterium]
MSGYASANIDGTIMMASIKVGVTASGLPLATFRVSAGLQSHPAYATGKAAMDALAYAEAAKRFNVPLIIVNLRAQLISAENVTILVVQNSQDIYWHPSAEVRNAAEFAVARMTGKLKGRSLPPDWPTTPLAIPISAYQPNEFRKG